MRIIRKTKELLNEIKWRHQSAKRGFSDYDVYGIDAWFMRIMPKMLLELKEHYSGFPTFLENKYYEEHIVNQFTISDEERDKMEAICTKKWSMILEEMINHFKEGEESTCSYKNKYAKEYHKAYKEYSDVYGIQGEKLPNNLKVENSNDPKLPKEYSGPYYSAKNPINFEDVSEENAKISRLYFEEDKRIEEYRDKHKKQALKMFVKYFDYLWW